MGSSGQSPSKTCRQTRRGVRQVPASDFQKRGAQAARVKTLGGCLLAVRQCCQQAWGRLLPSPAWEEPQLLPALFVPLLPWDKRKGTCLWLHPIPWGGWHTIHLPLPKSVKCSGTQQHLPWSPGPPLMGLGAWTAFPIYFERQIRSHGYAVGW